MALFLTSPPPPSAALVSLSHFLLTTHQPRSLPLSPHQRHSLPSPPPPSAALASHSLSIANREALMPMLLPAQPVASRLTPSPSRVAQRRSCLCSARLGRLSVASQPVAATHVRSFQPVASFLPPLSFQYLCRRRGGVNLQSRNFSSNQVKDELTIEEEAERKVGWLLKSIFFVSAGVAGYHFFPYMGENLMQQSVSLLHVKDPLFKRMGASRLARFAIDDERRMKIVEIGGDKELLNMLSTAKDDRTRKAALIALDALSYSDKVLASLHCAGAVSIIRSAPNSLEDADVEKFKLRLMKRFQDKNYDVSS